MSAAAEISLESIATVRSAKPSWLRHAGGRLVAGARWAAGLFVTILLLAAAAAVPILNVTVLGYLLEVEGRIARGVPFSDAFPFIRRAPRIGAAVALCWAWLL